MQHFLKPVEVARALRISRSACYELIAKGVLPAVRLGPRCVRVPASALEQLERQALAGGGEHR